MFYLIFIFRIDCDGPDCGSTEVSRKRDQHSEQLDLFNEMNSQAASRQHKDTKAVDVLPFIGLTGSKSHNSKF